MRLVDDIEFVVRLVDVQYTVRLVDDIEFVVRLVDVQYIVRLVADGILVRLVS